MPVPAHCAGVDAPDFPLPLKDTNQMDYIAPRNYPPTVDEPRPSYPDGNKAAGVKGAIPPGSSIEHPMREILHCIEQSGQTPNVNDLTQLWQAILAAVAAGGGGGGSPPTVDFSVMPLYPEVTSNAGLFTVTPTTGQVVVADATTFVHRGGNSFLTTDTPIGDRTFITAANKTYHLLWRYNGGSPVYELKDLADGAYNPGALAESHAGFDTTFDNMLIARVVTNGANTPAITALYNKARLALARPVVGVHTLETGGGPLGGNNPVFKIGDAFNWSRRPDVYAVHLMKGLVSGGGGDADFNTSLAGTETPSVELSRYRLDTYMMRDYTVSLAVLWSAQA